MSCATHSFLTFLAISSKPGNPIHKTKIRAGAIESFSVATEEYITIGAATQVYLINGSMMLVKESFEDVEAMFELIEKEEKV